MKTQKELERGMLEAAYMAVLPLNPHLNASDLAIGAKASLKWLEEQQLIKARHA